MSISYKHIVLLLKIKLQILINGFTKAEQKKRSQKFFSLAAGSILFYFIYLSMFNFFSVLVKDTTSAVPLIDNAIMLIFLGFFIFLLASGITISIHYLFISSDLPLLMSSPISDKTIFTFKLIEAIFANSTFFFFIGTPIFIAYGITTHAAWFYYPLIVILALCFLVIPVSISFLGALLVVKFTPASKARELMAIFLGIVSFGLWLALQLFRVSSFDKSSPEFDQHSIEQLSQISQKYFLNLLPSTWAARALSGFAHADGYQILMNFLPLLLLTACLFYIGVNLSKNAFEKGFISSQQSVTIKRKKRHQNNASVQLRDIKGGFSGIVRALLIRDFRLFTRDSRQITNIIMMTAIMIFFPFVQNRNQLGPEFSLYQPYIIIIFFGSLLVLQISYRLFPLEGKSFWITKIAPQSALRIIWGKFILSFLLGTGLLWISVIIISTYFEHPLRIKILAFIATSSLSAIFSSIGLLIGIYYARFDWDHPKRMLSTTGGFIQSLSVFAVIGIIGAIIALIYFVGGMMQLSLHFLDMFSVLTLTIIISVAIVTLNMISARKLDNMEWLF